MAYWKVKTNDIFYTFWVYPSRVPVHWIQLAKKSELKLFYLYTKTVTIFVFEMNKKN